MHTSVMLFVEKAIVKHALRDLAVLEVGSLNVNGSVRPLFRGSYVGTDMRAGPGVDKLVNAHDLDRSDLGYWPLVVVCTEMLEHDDAPWLSLKRMRDVAHQGSLLLLTCRGYDERGCFPVHDYPDDLWRFSIEGVRALLTRTGWEPVEVERDPQAPGVFAIARAR